MREQRSLLNFAILIVVSSATAVFILNNARKAIAEIDVLNSRPVIAQRQFIADDDKKIDTSNWKTYRNEEFGFEVRYPENWRVRDITTQLGVSTDWLAAFALNPETRPTGDFFNVVIWDNNKVHKEDFPCSGERRGMDVSIDGVIHTKCLFKLLSDATLNNFGVHIEKGGLLFNLSCTDIETIGSQCDLVLSTFKFIK